MTNSSTDYFWDMARKSVEIRNKLEELLKGKGYALVDERNHLEGFTWYSVWRKGDSLKKIDWEGKEYKLWLVEASSKHNSNTVENWMVIATFDASRKDSDIAKVEQEALTTLEKSIM